MYSHFIIIINIVLYIHRVYFGKRKRCIMFISNEGDTDIFYDNGNDTIEKFISFAVMEDKTIVDQELL